jgi:hypothetical protein
MKPKKIKLEQFAPQGTKHCEAKCNREIVITKTGPVIVCHGCNRIVIDNRENK